MLASQKMSGAVRSRQASFKPCAASARRTHTHRQQHSVRRAAGPIQELKPSFAAQLPAARIAGRVASRSIPTTVAAAAAYASKAPADIRVLVVGPTGYIGKFVVKELISRGYNVVAFAREQAGIKGKMSKDDTKKEFEGAEVRFGNVTDLDSIREVAFKDSVDVVVSCLASRTGGKKDSWAIDYQATSNVLKVAREKKAPHFVLLSAICVQKPLLEFQKAKLKFESELQAAGDITYSIVRPTAFFKSLAGQIKLVQDGKPYVMFGDGQLASCKPISEADLASYIADCCTQEQYVNKVLPIGGPGKAYSAKEQAELLFKLTGKPENTFPVPVALMDGIIGILDFLAKFFPNLEDAAEFGRIGKYYAVESMLVWDEKTGKYLEDETPSYGNDTLEDFFKKVLKEGLQGQELGDQAVFGVSE